MSKTATKALSTEGKLREAEAVEREAVSLLEITGPQSLLADALISHGITLARLAETGTAELALNRALIVALQIGSLYHAGLVALTMIEELDGLSAEALITNYERASTWLAEDFTRELLHRINDASRKILFRLGGTIDPDEALEILLRKNSRAQVETFASSVGGERRKESPRNVPLRLCKYPDSFCL
jgi:hypothetical protein